MLINGPSNFQYKLPRRPVGLQEKKFGIGTFVAFFTTKVIRGGPRLVLHLITGVVVLLLILKVLPHGYGRYNIWPWHNATNNRSGTAADGSVAGGIRVVVFGTHDVANPGRVPGPEYVGTDKRGWTELLCAQLNCSSYMTFVPAHGPSHTMTSTRIYADTVDQVTNATFGTDGPGMDYSFLPEKFPVTWDIPDLEQQVTNFLRIPKPQNSPAETLWVFSFGTWDVWSLASEPREFSVPAVDAILNHILKQVERIYQAVMDESSIAWSNSSLVLHAEPTRTDKQAEDGGTGVEAGKPTPTAQSVGFEKKPVALVTDQFRIMIPKLFDPSLTPGWQTARPMLPEVHSKAEQMRNAAALTDRWNMQMNRRLFKWVWTTDESSAKEEPDPLAMYPNYPRPKKVLTGKEAMAAFIQMLEDTKPKKNPKGKTIPADADQKKPTELPQPVQPRGVQEVAPEPATGVTVVISEEAQSTLDPAARPQRDAYFFEMDDFLADLIIDRQFRNTGLKDSLGVGTKPTEEGFLEVWLPCTEDLPDEHVEVLVPSTPAIRGRSPVPIPTGTASPSNETAIAPRICEAPHEHLFFTPFTVSPRAVEMVAKQAADMIRQGKTTRAHMAKYNLVPIQKEPAASRG